ncbi:MAG: SRPBCC family protein, partial [Flavobacteriales bacterium]
RDQTPLRMKAIKTILIIVVALLAICGIMYAMGDSTFRVERSVTIKAPVETVYAHVSTLAAMDKWSPWNEYDPNMKKSMEGTDGAIGAKAKWEGNSDVGTGSQEIVALDPNKKVSLQLNFMEPMESTSNVDLELTTMGDSTKVTWAMHGNNEGIGRVMSMFFNMDKMIGPDFEKGLGYLKKQAEESAAAMAKAPAKIEVSSGDRPAAMYVGIKSDPKLPIADLEAFYMTNSPKLFEALGKAGVKPAGPMCGLYYDWDMEHNTTSLMICVPVTEKVKVPGLVNDEIAAGKAYWTTMLGGYSGSYAAHTAVDEKLTAEGMEISGAVLEEYVVGQGTETDSTKFVTNIIYMAKPKG